MIAVYSLILSILLLLVFVANVIVCWKNRFFAPSLIVSAMLFPTSVISLIYLSINNLDIGWKTLLVFFGVDLGFFLANLLFKLLFKKKDPFKKKTNNLFTIHYKIDVNIFVIVGLSIVFVAIPIWQFISIKKQLVEFGYKNLDDIKNFYSAMRAIYTSNNADFKFNAILIQLLAFQRAFTYIFSFIFIHNIILYTFKPRDLLLLLPVPSYVFAMFLTSGRTEFLMYFLFLTLILVFCLSDKSNNNIILSKILSISLIVLLAIIAGSIFVGFRYFMRTQKDFSDLFRYVYQYSSSPYYAVEQLLNGGVQYESTPFGSHTLYSIYSFIEKLGISMPDIHNPALPPVTFGGITTNIYGAAGRWYMDYGYVGIAILTIFWSSLYSFLYYAFVEREKLGFAVLLYSMLAYTCFMFGIEDAFYGMFAISFIYKMVYLLIGYLLFVRIYHYNSLFKKKFVNSNAFLTPLNLKTLVIDYSDGKENIDDVTNLFLSKDKDNEFNITFFSHYIKKDEGNRKSIKRSVNKALIKHLKDSESDYILVLDSNIVPIKEFDYPQVLDASYYLSQKDADCVLLDNVYKLYSILDRNYFVYRKKFAKHSKAIVTGPTLWKKETLIKILKDGIQLNEINNDFPLNVIRMNTISSKFTYLKVNDKYGRYAYKAFDKKDPLRLAAINNRENLFETIKTISNKNKEARATN